MIAGTNPSAMMAIGNTALGAQSGYGNSIGWGFGGGQESGFSDSYNSGFSDSYNSGFSNSWSNEYSDNWSSAEGNSWGWGDGQNWSNSWNNGASSNAVYGSEASAKDILRAQEANAIQDYFNKQQMAYNSKEAQIARDFEAYMSNTSYQRAVEDLRKAGLNPILAAMNMGASTPGVIAASSGLASANKATTYADSRGSSYNTGGSNSYGYNKSQNGSSYSSKSEGHSRASSGSHSENYGKSHSENNGKSHSENTGKSTNFNYSKSHNEYEPNINKIVKGIGDMFSGLSSGMKEGGYPGDNKGTGKGWDGYDNPTVSN